IRIRIRDDCQNGADDLPRLLIGLQPRGTNADNVNYSDSNLNCRPAQVDVDAFGELFARPFAADLLHGDGLGESGIRRFGVKYIF
uniref:Porin n=1 Tax=Bursaphelenchus xylophilus TaxID=6326 RepID=A0A1I7SPB2_BURXY